MQKTIALSLLTFLPCLLFAQRQYLDAIVTTNDGKKIVGQIAVESWLATPRSIDFRVSEGSEKIYYVADLSGFEITRHDSSKLFFSRYIGDIESSLFEHLS